MKHFEPIAIVGRSCVLPGALTPQELGDACRQGRDLLSGAPVGRWRLGPGYALGEDGHDRAWTDRGGYVTGFEDVWDPAAIGVDEEAAIDLDPLFRWALWGTHQALVDAGAEPHERIHLVLGNLSFPSEGMTEFGESTLLGMQPGFDTSVVDVRRRDPRNRFMSGYPAHFAAQALGLGEAFAIDAACATGLYALALGAQRLTSRRADIIVAGAMNRADSLFLHVGFCALRALSRSGKSRPFHRDADGLVPAEGAAFVVLKRLADARAAGDRVLGVIRGIGLSNDGRGRGFLAPSRAGQVRALRSAYVDSGIEPREVEYVECHATGTSLGDATELASMAEIWADGAKIGSHKSNMGHAITAAGLVGTLKMLDAFEHGVLAPTIGCDQPVDTGAFEIVRSAQTLGGRMVGVSAFGFGGNNAHVVLEHPDAVPGPVVVAAPAPPPPVVICGLEVQVGGSRGGAELLRRLARPVAGGGRLESFELDLEGLRFPPRDLEQTLPQQLVVLELSRRLAGRYELDPERTSVLVGMGCDASIVRYGARWRSAAWAEAWGYPDAWVHHAREAIVAGLESQGVVGSMPNIVANRINSQLGLSAPSFTVSGEELSGVRALEIATQLLDSGEIDAALVGAVDMSNDAVHRAAADAVLDSVDEHADGALVLLVCRREHAEARGWPIYAELGDSDAPPALPGGIVSRRAGHSHAAAGLLEVAAAAYACRHGVKVSSTGIVPWIAEAGEEREACVELRAMGGQRARVALRALGEPVPFPQSEAPAIWCVAGVTKQAVVDRLGLDEPWTTNEAGPVRFVMVARPSQLEERRATALRHLQAGRTSWEWARLVDAPVEGELAFVFTGSASPYVGMGAGLCTALPGLAAELNAQIGGSYRRATQAGWVWEDGVSPSAEQQIWAASWLSLLHARLTRDVLGLQPRAALGYSLGESNALFALGAWGDPGAMMREIEEGGIFRDRLTGDFTAVREAWSEAGHLEAAARSGPELWQSWTLVGSVDRVRAVVDAIDLVHVTCVNTDDECVISGAESACEAALAELLNDPKMFATELPYDVAIHCPEAARVADEYRGLHDRETSPVPGVRFYSNAGNDHYELSRQACADALLCQATTTVDFPRTVLKAWEDGVRVFVEHGPRSLCSGWISRILGDREHVVVPLDERGRDGLDQVLVACATMIAHGVDVDWRALTDRLEVEGVEAPRRPHAVPVHQPDVVLRPWRPSANVAEPTLMPPAPLLPPPLGTWIGADASSNGVTPANGANGRPGVAANSLADAAARAADFQRQVGTVHAAFLADHTRLHHQFLALHEQSVERLAQAYLTRGAAESTPTLVHDQLRSVIEAPKGAVPSPAVRAAGHDSVAPWERSPRWISREELEHMSRGKISEVLGPEFEPQDDYAVQVRMPEPPLLLADRVMEIEGTPASMKPGRIVTETDVRADSWYLHNGRMPAGIMIESGQADLLLVSFLGVDLLNRGERAYRLLGCTLTYRGDLPRPGETLRYDIAINGFAKHGEVRLFFFGYDCTVGGDVRLEVRHGQAGFFTDAELAESGGVLWEASSADYDDAAPVASPTSVTRGSFDRGALEAFSEGRPWECFGADWEYTKTHLRTPTISAGRMLFLDEVVEFDPAGGPWGKGYLRAETESSPNDWFFEGHFHNDPCMPGTLMFEGALQAMTFYMAACGFTIERDGWRFQPVADIPYEMRCRGQVDPGSTKLVYEIFVEESYDGAEDGIPRLYADMLVTVDGLKAFHCRRMGLELVPDYPYERGADLIAAYQREGSDGSALFDFPAVLAAAIGRPSDAFGAMYAPFDGPRLAPRLPGPPYHFVTRVREAPGHLSMAPGAEVVVEYDVPADAWYFAEGGGVMPLAVLLEVGLQPCGWLATWVGCTLAAQEDVFFRNLDGVGTQHRAVGPDAGMLVTRSRLEKLSRSGDMIIVGFEVEVSDALGPVYSMNTVFGFFPQEALASQAGIADGPELPADDDVCDLPGSGELLALLERVTHHAESGGLHGLGRVTCAMDVDPGHWFFKAHFFSDPVQPGSIGLGLLLDALSAWASLTGHIPEPTEFVAPRLGLEEEHVWKYRGQVRPHARRVHVDVHVKEVESERIRADGWLWVDGARIYSFRDFTLSTKTR